MNYHALPKYINNDIGGTSLTNIRHFELLLETGEFLELKTKKLYDKSRLMTNLKGMPIQLFVGTADSFT